jgi:Fur family zinc uptake transcriptional regulator
MLPAEDTDDAAGLTRNEELVFRVLARSVVPMGAYAILNNLRSQGLRSALQVYRALDRLMQRGLVHRLESLNAYLVCTQHCRQPHAAAFAICDRCGAAREFHEAAIEHALENWARRNGFHPSASSVELRGLCRSCAHE